MTDPNEHKIGFENLPNVYFKRLRTRMPATPFSSENITVTGLLTIFEGAEQKYWDDDSYFRSFLRIRIKVFEHITRGPVAAAAAGGLRIERQEFFIDGPFIGNKPIPFRIDVPKEQKTGLYISANLEMNLESFSNLSFDFGFGREWYRGPTTEEKIFDMNDKIFTMYRYLSGDKVHFGPVHTHMAAGMFPIIMPGSFHKDPTTGQPRKNHGTLQRDDSFNFKNYYIEDVFNRINTETERWSYIVPVWLTNFSSNQNEIYFHLFVSDSNLALRTKVGRRLAQINIKYFKEIKKKVQINSIKVRREKVIVLPGGQKLNVGATTQSIRMNAVLKTILDATYPKRKNTQKFYSNNPDEEDELKSQIVKSPFIANSDVSLYTITDYDVSAYTDEHFSYDVQISYTSLIDEMLKEKISKMRDYLASLQTIYQTFYNNSEYYSHEYEMLTPLGFQALNAEYGFAMEQSGEYDLKYNPTEDDVPRQSQAYWFKIPKLYTELLMFLQKEDVPKLSTQITLFNLLNPIAASPETFVTAIRYLTVVIQNILREYDISLPLGGNSIGSNIGTSLPSSNSNEYSHYYSSSEIIEHPAYLVTTPHFDFIQSDGLEMIGDQFLKRADTELGEFVRDLKIKDPSEYPNYSNEQISNLTSPRENISFLTPKMVSLQGNDVMLTSLDTDAPDNLRMFKAMSNPQVGLKFSSPLKNLLEKKRTSNEPQDVREYVGDDSLFALTSGTNFLQKIKKIKPEILEASLNFYSNKGRNVSLDSIRKFNIPAKMLPPSVKNVFLKDFKNLDPFKNLKTRDAFFNKHFNTIQIYCLVGFETYKDNGLINITQPIYKPISKDKIKKSKYLICRAEPIDVLSSLDSSYEKIDKKNIKNRVFIIKHRSLL